MSEKKKSATEKKKEPQEQFFFMKLNTKPLKFKCRLANGGGGAGGGGLVDPCKAWVPPPSNYINNFFHERLNEALVPPELCCMVDCPSEKRSFENESFVKSIDAQSLN